MNTMYNLIQFIASSPTLNIDDAFLAQLFMYDVITIFGMCSMVIIENGSTFKSIFVGICTALGINQ